MIYYFNNFDLESVCFELYIHEGSRDHILVVNLVRGRF